MSVTPPDPLYPLLEPYATGRLKVDARHTLYWEECGNPTGVPVVFLHGGPGGGCLPHHRRFFDPSFWRIILFDQRGAGRSTPVAELTDNTTAHLVADMDRLRQARAIKTWALFGGSWGSTLALAYAEAHPARCSGLILRGIFLARQTEINWFMQGMGTIFPEAARAFADHLPPSARSMLLEGYYARLIDADPAIHMPAARAWDRYESACSTLLPLADAPSRLQNDACALAIARIEAHYFMHRAFLPENALLAQLDTITHLPCTIVQGRYDIVCPIVSADALARAWPDAEYVVVPDAGHSIREPGIARALVDAVARMQSRHASREPAPQQLRDAQHDRDLALPMK